MRGLGVELPLPALVFTRFTFEGFELFGNDLVE
jgi:hypothetical protein